MSFTATIENGAIKIPADLNLPDGTQVRIEPLPESRQAGNAGKPFADRYAKYIGIVDDAPADLAENLDHYLYGHPKK